MKKSISVITCIILLLMSISPLYSAAHTMETENAEFDLSQYTWEDIMTMDNAEFRRLLADFERVYDPFETYQTSPLVELKDNQIQPLWTSGQKDLSEVGSHELITARACGILLQDKGFWGENHNGSIVVALTIALASIIPDRDLLEGIGSGYAGHFYDPDTGVNYLNDSLNTARSNMINNFNAAKAAYQKNDTDTFLEAVGKMLHYMQDACEPHHAANVTAVIVWQGHSAFEKYADERLNQYIDPLQSLYANRYTWAAGATKETMIYSAAKQAKLYISLVNNTRDKSEWDYVAFQTTRNAVENSTLLLYRLSLEAGIPLVK